jgi:uroporphyrinogen-III synthase
VYAWALPSDTAPLAAAVDALCAGRVDVLTLTSGQQLEHLFQLANRSGRADELLAALRTRVVCASIGPVTSEALTARGIPVDLTPEHPKMGHLVSAVAKHGQQLLAAKRSG